MQPLTVADIRPPSAYEPVRGEARRRIVELKRPRRVRLGELLTLTFENRDTVRGVVEELLRAERIETAERIAEELEVFNTLIPGPSELSATLFLEIADPAEMAIRLAELRGIEAGVHLEVDGRRIGGNVAEGPVREDGSSVHHLRFRLEEAQMARLRDGAEVAAVADHEHYRARTVLDEEQVAALRSDLAAQ
ncbi:MAG TPA: DUF3501 family protein [Candidatus Dormibacteraeota bacterium]